MTACAFVVLFCTLQMDHIEQNVQDVMDRNIPRVPPHRYSINFVPAVTKNSDVTHIRNTLLFDPRYASLFLDDKSVISNCTVHQVWAPGDVE